MKVGVDKNRVNIQPSLITVDHQMPTGLTVFGHQPPITLMSSTWISNNAQTTDESRHSCDHDFYDKPIWGNVMVLERIVNPTCNL